MRRPGFIRSHRYSALTPGPRLIVLGAVHGNEVCGTRAIERIVQELDAGHLALVRGTVTFVPVTNPLAYAQGTRTGDRNLNRRLRVSEHPEDYEDHVANALCPLLDQHEVLLDLHSFHTPGDPFVMLGPQDNAGPLEAFRHARAEEALALCLGPVRVVEGWLDTYARGVAQRVASGMAADPSYGIGTTEYFRSRGGYGLTLECGEHDDPAAVEVAYAAVRRCLQHLGLTAPDYPPAAGEAQVLRLVEFVDLQHEGDRLAREWTSFDRVTAGELIGTRAHGAEWRAPRDGFVVFPNPAAQPGSEWFYFAEPSSRRLRTR
ncbi:succinylglutamate desuccinylase/aspartoacylase family protein [Niveibacterium sp. SC-1]|uniref:succinylglutamate desuccinylase/aspartoacylase domain-containing protein n=1 Tax=Niveibacterium sp. SC-1 TaxID=3135646 RepID=UPI00311FD84A